METTKSIVQLKSAFSLSEWQVQVTACQESGKTVKEVVTVKEHTAHNAHKRVNGR